MPLWLPLAFVFAPPVPWALNVAAPPRIPAVADLNGDGFADLLAINPDGEGAVDASLSIRGMKPGRPFQVLAGWGRGCVSAIGGEFDGRPGADVLALCSKDGTFELRLAGGYEAGKLKAGGVLASITKKFKEPVLSSQGGLVTITDRKDGQAVSLVIGEWKAENVRSKDHAKPIVESLTSRFAEGDADNDGDLDVFEFRYGKEPHSAYEVQLRRLISAGETDSDADGLDNESEARLLTDATKPDTDGDGLLDGWEVHGFRGLDMPALGCDPKRIDVICLISRFDDVPEDRVKAELGRAVKTYEGLGWGLHIVYRDPVAGEDKKRPWWQNRDRNLPSEWRGVVHWMQVTLGGGGQADQMGDGGSCGLSALWAVFLHEFGHQIGMDHNGFWRPAFCPIYRSLMSYAYSYALEDDANKIAYSKGELSGYTLTETNLDETIPLPYEKVKFLEKGPYRFRLKPNGSSTLIDWNWNGVFGEKGIRADINYAYATSAGARDDVDRAMSAPWLFVHRGSAFALFGQRTDKLEAGKDPNVSVQNPGQLVLRRLISPKVWDKPIIVDDKVVGDPVAISAGGKVAFVYARPEGIVLRRGLPGEDEGRVRIGTKSRLVTKPPKPSEAYEILDSDPSKIPTVGQIGDRTYIFLWDPRTHEVTYRSLIDAGKVSAEKRLFERSTVPVGMAVDTVRKEVILGMAQDQDSKKTSRWQVRRYEELEGSLRELGVDWVDGPAGNSRISGRVRVLFKQDRDTGPHGRIYMYAKGFHGEASPWACTYVAESIADKSVRGGWLVKRMYDEWTQSRSAPAATWFQGDVLWAYRWVDGGNPDRDNILHIGYHGLGIDSAPMGDHDDITFLKEFGIRSSILYLNP